MSLIFKRYYKYLLFTFFLFLIFAFLFLLSPLYSLAFVLFLTFLLIFFDKPEISLYIIIFSIIFGQLVRLPLGTSEGTGAIILSDVFVPAAFIFFLARKFLKRLDYRWQGVDTALTIFLVLSTLSLLLGSRYLPAGEILTASFYLIRLIAYVGLFFICKDLAKDNISFAKNVVYCLIAVSFLLAITGVLQYFIFPSMQILAQRGGWDPHFKRAFASFLDPNFLGSFLSFGVALTLSLYFYSKKSKERTYLLLIAAVLILALFLTYSRTAYIALFISFVVITAIHSKKILFWGVLILTLVFVLNPQAMQKLKDTFNQKKSGYMRLVNWKRGWETAKTNLYTGVGYNAIGYYQKEVYRFYKKGSESHSITGSDSSFLFLLATTGFFGLLSFLLVLFLFLQKSFRLFQSASSPPLFRALALALFSILLSAIVAFQFINGFFYPHLMIFIYIVAGIIFSLNSHDKIKKEGIKNQA